MFGTAGFPNVPLVIDPEVATGDDDAIGAGDLLFASVTLPIGVVASRSIKRRPVPQSRASPSRAASTSGAAAS